MSRLICPTEISKLNLNCAGESKSGVLTLCSGVTLATSMINQTKIKFDNTSLKPVDKRLGHLQEGLHAISSLDKAKQSRCPENGNSPEKFPESLTLPKQVKVSVYSNVVNPYLVIYSSIEKYSKPAVCLKLLSCTVRVLEDPLDESSFEIISQKHQGGDIDCNANTICLRAPNHSVREDWLRILIPLTTTSRSTDLPGYQPGSSVLPTLQEDEDTDKPLPSPTEKLKMRPRRKSLEGRRNSLNSIGARLRSYKFGRGKR